MRDAGFKRFFYLFGSDQKRWFYFFKQGVIFLSKFDQAKILLNNTVMPMNH